MRLVRIKTVNARIALFLGLVPLPALSQRDKGRVKTEADTKVV